MSRQAELVHLGIAGPTATITLDSLPNRNALSDQLVRELVAHLNAAAASPHVRVVVLTHEGTTFCSGADLGEAAARGMEHGTRALLGLLRVVVSLPVPVVALVRGHARAGGVGLVGACDLAVVDTASTFAFTEALLGLAPAIISLTTRSRMTDRDAARWYLTGETFDGVEAARCGLATQAVPADSLDQVADSLVAQFARVSPQGLRETKRLLNAELLARIESEGEALVALSARLFASDEAREGITAFRERRPAAWTQTE